ncbi:uncharacterized protein [Diadema setosum]|uniref:uncharacterized protein n=1 Tax=Diadema setosum TaxID=31175 RepID=UPI003B3BC318
MASASLPTPATDWSNPDRAQALREFKQLANMWFTIKRVAEVEQHTYIIMWSGKEGLRMFNTWKLTDDEVKDPANIWKAFSSQIEPQENFRIHRLEFQRYRQGVNEPIDDFMLRCKTKAVKCRFQSDAIIEERVIEVLIAGVRHPEVQKILLSRDEKLTLDEALKITRSHEASAAHMNQLSSLDKTSVHAMHTGQQCKNCGTTHKPKQCREYHSICHKCRRKGHWKQCCRSQHRDRSASRGRSQEKQARGRGRSRSRGRGYSHPNQKGQQQNSRNNRRDSKEQHLHPIGPDRQDNPVPTFENLTLGTITVGDVHSNQVSDAERDELFATLNISLKRKPGNHTLRVKVDTGAQSNVLPLRIFKVAFPDLVDEKGYPLESSVTPSQTKLYAYNGSIIPQYGSIDFPCQYADGKWFRTEFFIVETAGPALLGLQSAVKMKLVQVHCETHQEACQIRSIEDLESTYPDRFQGLGRLPGECHITLMEDALPVVHPPRKFPIKLKDELKQELDRMEAAEVIAKVTEPTDWVSSLAFSRKSNGKLRVCLDPKDLNRACKRTYHKTPTIEETTHKLHGAQVFSKLDARSGYWSIVLDEESSFLTTFNSPFGRYRFRRLPFGIKVAQDVFQERMDQILEQCPGTIGIADDIVVFGHNEAEHDKALHNLMTVARKYGLVFNAEKCSIKQPQITFFGCVYDKDGIHPDPAKVRDIVSLPEPTNIRELQQFLGIV